MVASPEAARFVLVTHADLFRPSYPTSKETLIGKSAIFFHQGTYHSRVRKLVQTSLSLDVIRCFIPSIESIALSTLNSWCTGGVVNTFFEMKKVCTLCRMFDNLFDLNYLLWCHVKISV